MHAARHGDDFFDAFSFFDADYLLLVIVLLSANVNVLDPCKSFTCEL
jgi:hypothetical protein